MCFTDMVENFNMAISEFELKRCEKQLETFLSKHRPPAHVRSQLDIGYRIKNQSVEIFEIRPDFRDETNKIEISVAKATFVKTKKNWKIYWQKSDQKWHSYDPEPSVKSIDAFLDVVSNDDHACFFG
jgi:hypothetical protein